MLETDLDLPTHLRLAVMRLSRRLRHESMTDRVSPSMLAALSTIERHGPAPITIGDLAAAEQVSPPSMTRTVANLEEQALVTRQVDAADRRVVRLAITPDGARTLSEIRTRKQAFLAERLDRLSAADRATLAAAVPVLEHLAGEPDEAR
jgi:DNA-binding MarR family transcriptional regulator